MEQFTGNTVGLLMEQFTGNTVQLTALAGYEDRAPITVLIWVILQTYYYYHYYCLLLLTLISLSCRVFALIFLKQTMFLGYTVMQLFCIYSLSHM
jgi:hypothetical protein